MYTVTELDYTNYTTDNWSQTQFSSAIPVSNLMGSSIVDVIYGVFIHTIRVLK